MIKKRTLFILTFLIYVQASALIAGITGKITGTIVDVNTGDALAGANVLISGTNLGAAAGIDGKYFILNVPPGNYELKISMMGYKATIVRGVQVKIDQTTIVDGKLEPTILEGEEIYVVAEKPKVEFDLTASKQAMSAGEVNQSWGTELKEVISDLPGVNVNGGIRGGYGLDVAYNLNGMDMRDVGSNTNFSLINLTTIQQVEVLTGGFNAEYGQANGAIVNIVTRNAKDRMHGVVQYKLRPAGKYHWGDHIFADDGIYRGIMTTPEFWDPDATWQTQWMDEPMKGYDGGRAPYRDMTPDQRPQGWNHWAEVVWKNPKTPEFIGDMPHTWVGSDYINAVRSFFVYEDEADSSLVVGAGLSEDWIDSPEGIEVNNLPTFYGELNYSIQKTGDNYRVELTGDMKMPQVKIRVKNFRNEKPKQVWVNNRLTSNFEIEEVMVEKFPAVIELRY